MLTHPLSYASGGTGWTARLHIYASGGTQKYTWKTQQGFLSSAADVRNQEVTIYARLHQVLDVSRLSFSLKIRGGAHSSSNGDLSSCTMMTLEPGGTSAVTRFRKELNHPNYDSKRLTPLVTGAELRDATWYGLKLVSFGPVGDATRTINRLYVDLDPIDFATGKPKNNWRLLSEYADVEGVSFGTYSKLASWGGWVTTFRTDGFHDLDFALFSVREIAPPP